MPVVFAPMLSGINGSDDARCTGGATDGWPAAADRPVKRPRNGSDTSAMTTPGAGRRHNKKRRKKAIWSSQPTAPRVRPAGSAQRCLQPAGHLRDEGGRVGQLPTLREQRQTVEYMGGLG